MILVDGAQAFAHVPIRESLNACDCYIIGCHKWLGAHLPLGVAFCPCSTTSNGFSCALSKADDPLLAYTCGLDAGDNKQFGETVNLTPLLTCRGALADQGQVDRELLVRLESAQAICDRLGRNLQAIAPSEAFRSGIILVKTPVRTLEPHALRSLLAARGVMLTAYDGGFVRLSLPKSKLTPNELDLLVRTLQSIDVQVGGRCLVNS